jgi:glc operon protein GlcG
MANTRGTIALTHEGALNMLAAAASRAAEMKVPQCIVIVDASGETIASLRMDGAKYLSMQTARSKARTAASINNATGAMAAEFAVQAGIATGGGVTGLMGGLPIRFGGKLAGGIGIGSGKGEEDVDVARSALSAVGADQA